MPFPVIERKRYFQYAFGIGSLLVITIIKFSFSTHTIITFLLKMLDLEHLEISSHSLLQHFLVQHTDNINNKF